MNGTNEWNEKKTSIEFEYMFIQLFRSTSSIYQAGLPILTFISPKTNIFFND